MTQYRRKGSPQTPDLSAFGVAVSENPVGAAMALFSVLTDSQRERALAALGWDRVKACPECGPVGTDFAALDGTHLGGGQQRADGNAGVLTVGTDSTLTDEQILAGIIAARATASAFDYGDGTTAAERDAACIAAFRKAAS